MGNEGVTARTGGNWKILVALMGVHLGVKPVPGSRCGHGWIGSHCFELGVPWRGFSGLPDPGLGGGRTSQTPLLGGFIRN